MQIPFPINLKPQLSVSFPCVDLWEKLIPEVTKSLCIKSCQVDGADLKSHPKQTRVTLARLLTGEWLSPRGVHKHGGVREHWGGTRRLFGWPHHGEHLTHLYKELLWHPETITPSAVPERRASLPPSRLLRISAGSPSSASTAKAALSDRCFGAMGLIRQMTSGYVFLPVGESAWIWLPPACLFAHRNQAIVIYLIFKVLSAEDFNLIIPELWPTTSSLDPWPSSFMKGCF